MTTTKQFRSTLIDNEFCTIYFIYKGWDVEVRRIDKVLCSDKLMSISEFIAICKQNNFL